MGEVRGQGGSTVASNNPLLDEHIIYAATLMLLMLVCAGRYWGLGRWWESKHPVLAALTHARRRTGAVVALSTSRRASHRTLVRGLPRVWSVESCAPGCSNARMVVGGFQ